LTVTFLPDLPPIDFSQVKLESVTATDEDLSAAGISPAQAAALFRSHLKLQALDCLHEAYSFPVLPAMVEREFAGLWKTAEDDLGTSAIGSRERAALAAEFREIAERRVRLGLVIAEMSRRYGVHAPDSASLEEAVIDRLLAQAQVTQRRATVNELRQMIDG
jgi:FKBP-type peptidyl-prolyl cis-trans isomerase (trigger factor)